VSATAAICNELQLPPLSRRCSDPHCLDIDFRDRTVGPTFPTSCRQSAWVGAVRPDRPSWTVAAPI